MVDEERQGDGIEKTIGRNVEMELTGARQKRAGSGDEEERKRTGQKQGRAAAIDRLIKQLTRQFSRDRIGLIVI